MVMVITFLTLSNIAIGYGLAVYVQKNFGTLIYRRHAKAAADAAAFEAAPRAVVTAAPVIEKAPAVAPPAPVAPPMPEPVVAEAPTPPAPAEVAEGTPDAEAIVEVKAEADTVDEENVLAGIEEFRSQLAKMSENTASETAEQPAGAPQQGLATAVN